MKTFAAIDIGTNTILMTIARGDSPDNFEVLEDIHSIARLGEGVDKTGIISSDAFKRAEMILLDYRKIIDKHQPDKVQAVCTSAMRDAKNSLEMTKLFNNILSSEVKIIQGDEEAALSYLGTINDGEESLVIDIGGGSTEIIIGENFNINYRISTELGAVRLTERFLKSNPPLITEIEAMTSYVQTELNKVPYGDFSGNVYAVAGTATSLAAIDLGLVKFDRDLIHNHKLFLHSVNTISNELLSMSSKEIEQKYNIPQKRADVLPAGSIILREIMRSMNCSQITVSSLGLRYGIIKQMMSDRLTDNSKGSKK